MSPPFNATAGLTAPRLDAGFEEATLEVIAVASHACDKKLLQRQGSRARSDQASIDGVVPRVPVESEHCLAVRDAVSPLVIPADFRPVIASREPAVDAGAELTRVVGNR